MKKITVPTLFILFFSLFIGQLQAQTDYTYTLVDNGSFNYSIVAVPSTTTSNFSTSVQSYGFTIFVPDGVGLSITNSLAGGAGASPFNGDQVGGSASEDGFLITETLSAPVAIAAPSAGNASMVTIQLSNVSSGTVRIMPNDGPESTALGGALTSFLGADTTDDGMAEFPNTIINSATGLSGTSSHPLNTLSTPTSELVGVSIFPNPATDAITIKGLENNIQSVDVYNITGQKVITTTTNLETVNVSDLANGVYFLKLNAANATKTIKFIKE